MNTILVFDVETTGLLPKKPSDIQPNIIQFSFVLYDILNHSILETKNMYISVPESVIITPFISNLTGITREMIDKEGIPIEKALATFHRSYQKADLLVAHNIHFDLNLILLESNKHFPTICYDFYKDKKPVYCTMQKGIDLCRLERISTHGKLYFKFPKLAELYEYCFGDIPDKLHDSRIDVLCCLRCFLKIEMEYIIPTNDFITYFTIF